MDNYYTVAETLKGLKGKGYTINFNVALDTIMCNKTKICLNAHEFEITEIHRFKSATNSGNEEIVYAIESRDGMMKGIITSTYGVYADDVSAEIIKKLTIKR